MSRHAAVPEAPDLQILLAWRTRKLHSAAPLLRRAAAAACAAEGFRSGQLSVAVVGAAEMASLHAEFHADDSPTDVLTFDLDTDPPRHHLDGEIVVCADVAQAAAAPTDFNGIDPAAAELALYVVHGVLHLAGWNDHDPEDFRRMHTREDTILSDLGLGPVFRAASGRRQSR